MNRRDFGRLSAAAALAPFLTSVRRVPRKLKRVGLELYSVRGAMKRDPEGTLAGIRAIGYTDVELLWSFGNFGRTPAQVRDSLKASGLRAPSAHIDAGLLTGDWHQALADARLLGHQYLIVPGLPRATSSTLDGWRAWAERFNQAGAAARQAGVWLAFHNEPGHMQPLEGKVPYDVFIEALDPALVRLQLDLGNMVMGGGDPAVYLARYGDRYWSFHVKDVLPDRSRDTGLGKGIVPLGKLLASVRGLDDKPCFIEQEGLPDDLVAATADYAYLSRLDF